MTGVTLADIKDLEDLKIIHELAISSGKTPEEVAQGLEWVNIKMRKIISNLNDDQFNRIMDLKITSS